MIDQQLPIAIGRISAGLLAGGSVPDVLQQVGELLVLEKNNPLTPELILTATEMRVKDRMDALHSLAARSPSVSLANLAQLLEGFTEAGGRSYTQVLMDISTRVQQILMARNRAQAKAGDSVGLGQGFTGGAGIDPGLSQFRTQWYANCLPNSRCKS